MTTDTHFRIGELARRSGTSPDTIRFYEDRGLLAASARTEGGYRLFGKAELERLEFIQRAKKVGFTLEEISELMELRLHPDAHSCGEVKHHVEQKLAQVELKIRELDRIRQSLANMSAACEGGPQSAEHCTILQFLDSEDTL